MLSGIISNIGNNITQMNANTLQMIMKGMYFLINGKRNNMKTGALDICIFIYNQIGSENYLQLMNFSLAQDEVTNMGQAMESHRTLKNKAPQLSEVLKQHKMQIAEQRQSGTWGQNLRM